MTTDSMLTCSAASLRPTARSLEPLFSLLFVTAGVLTFLTVARLGLMSHYLDRVMAGSEITAVLWTGLRVDLITLGWMLSLPILLLPFAAVGTRGVTLWVRVSRVWWALLVTTMLILEVATPNFLAEYQARPNHLALEYLRDLPEVMPMLWNGFRLPLLLGVFALLVGTVAGFRWGVSPVAAMRLRRPWRVLLIWPLTVVLTVLMIRGSLDHRPANPALFARWTDGLVNELALNSSYRFGYALYAQKHEGSSETTYGGDADGAVERFLAMDPRFVNAPPGAPTRHVQLASAERPKPLNLIIVVLESQGADFSGRLGGQGLTPELDRWSERGWWFENLYATGTRSARGLEAIVAGFPPSPAPAVLKRPGAQRGFTTLASVLHEQGYQSRFIYGGGSHFDNMRGFFLSNGFDAVIDRDDYLAPKHVGSWGVSDEDLFDRALTETATQYAAGQTFFHLVFTSSNHTPFDFPANRLPANVALPGTVEGAVRYADYALGRFLDSSTQQPWFDETLIMVVADHDVRVYGQDVIPLRRFQIPGLLLGADLQPLTIKSLASQIDLAPTLLSVMGIDADVPFPGRDLTRSLPEFGMANGPAPRAILQFGDRHGWLQGNTLDVLHPDGHAECWQIGPIKDLVPGSLTELGLRRLQGSAHLGDWLYRQSAYASATK